MAKTTIMRLLIVTAVMVAIGLSLNAGMQEAEGGPPTPTSTALAATATSTPVAATATSTVAAATATPGTATAVGTRTATPVQPAAAPQTGGDPGSGAETLILTLLIGAVGIMSAGGVVAGYALGRRRS